LEQIVFCTHEEAGNSSSALFRNSAQPIKSWLLHFEEQLASGEATKLSAPEDDQLA
jgi:hypothetical protein